MKQLLAALLLIPTFAFATNETPLPPKPVPMVEEKPKDNWGGAGLHFAVSAVAGIGCRAYFEDNLKAFGCAMVPGLVKEVIDSQTKGNRFSTKDMIANAAGAALGVTVGHFTIEPKKDGVKVTYAKQF